MKEILVGGQPVEVKPLTFGQLPRVLPQRALLITAKFNPETFNPYQQSAPLLEQLLQVVSLVTGLSRDFIDNLSVEDGKALLAAVIEENPDYFGRTPGAQDNPGQGNGGQGATP